MQAKYNESGVLYAPNLLRCVRTTEAAPRPREDHVCIRGPEGSEVIIAATPERDEFIVEPQGGGVARRYTRVQVELLLALAAGASLVDRLAVDLDPGDRVMAVLADAWQEVIGLPLAVEPRTLPVLVIGRIDNADAAMGSVLALDLTPNVARLLTRLMRDRTALSPTQARLLAMFMRDLAVDDEREEDFTDSAGRDDPRAELRRLLDPHAYRKATTVIEDILKGALIERWFPGAEPREAEPHIGQAYEDAWAAVWGAADAVGVEYVPAGVILARHRRALLVGIYLAIPAGAPVPVGCLTPDFRHIVAERWVPARPGGPGRLAVQSVKVKDVVQPWTLQRVPWRLRRPARAIRKSDPGSRLVEANLSDGKRGRGRRLEVLAHSELALELHTATLDGSVADKLELAVERVPRDLPRGLPLMPSASSEQEDGPEREDDAPTAPQAVVPDAPQSWQVRIPETSAPAPVVRLHEQIGDFHLRVLDDGTVSVSRPPGDRIDGLLLTEDEYGWLRTALAEATRKKLEWSRLSPALQLIVGAGTDPGWRRARLGYLFQAVELPKPWEEAGPR